MVKFQQFLSSAGVPGIAASFDTFMLVTTVSAGLPPPPADARASGGCPSGDVRHPCAGTLRVCHNCGHRRPTRNALGRCLTQHQWQPNAKKSPVAPCPTITMVDVGRGRERDPQNRAPQRLRHSLPLPLRSPGGIGTRPGSSWTSTGSSMGAAGSMSDDEYYIEKKVPGKIYASRTFPVNHLRIDPETKELTKEIRHVRYLDRVFPDQPGEAFAEIKGETVIHTTPSAKGQTKILVTKDPRGIRSLILQKFKIHDDGATPSKTAHFSLYGPQIGEFMAMVRLALQLDFQANGKFRIEADALDDLEISGDAVRALLHRDPALLQTILNEDVTAGDVVATAYRKRQLKQFETLLLDTDAFAAEGQRLGLHGPEALWQRFFEENPWIFGGTLFVSSTGHIDDGKLERVVAGASVAGVGKRADALLRSRGRIGALCFVELKTHTTPLQQRTAYRPGVWAISDDLAGAVTQVHRTIQRAEQTIQTMLTPRNAMGDVSGPDAYLIRPRAVVVCGSLDQFLTNGAVNEDRYYSFELFRRHLQGPEVVTFDELLERARLLVE